MISSLPEECREFGDLKVFQDEEMIPEPPNPPMIASKNISLSKEELKILSKSPKFALMNILSKEAYMADVEKGLIKEKYGRIGKEEVNGKVVEDEMDEETRTSSEWLDRKSELIHDYEDNNIDFAPQQTYPVEG